MNRLYGQARAGKSLVIESFLVLVFYGAFSMLAFYFEMGLFNWQTIFLLPLGIFLPLFSPTPLPLLMLIIYLLLITIFSYFERNLFLHFVIGVTSSTLAALSIYAIVSFSNGFESSTTLLGEGVIGTAWWLFVSMIGSSVVYRSLRILRIVYQKDQNQGTVS